MNKIEEILPQILRDLSNGIAVSTIEIEKTHNVSASGVRSHLRTLKERFYKGCFKYDGSTKKWVPVEIGFLNRELLEPEEIVVLNGIYRNKKRLGDSLIETHEKLVESYLKRTKSYIFKQHISEELTEDMEQTFALLKRAISDKKVVELNYPSKGTLKIRRVYPHQVVYIEYYWYLICYEEDDKIKSFRLSLIQSPKMLDKTYSYNFENVALRLKLAMNAYVDYQTPIEVVNILVASHIVNHVEIASFFDAWRKTDYTISIEGNQFRRFEVRITNPDYKDVIPTILKYMPNMLVEEPIELKEEIDSLISKYTGSYLNA